MLAIHGSNMLAEVDTYPVCAKQKCVRLMQGQRFLDNVSEHVINGSSTEALNRHRKWCFLEPQKDVILTGKGLANRDSNP